MDNTDLGRVYSRVTGAQNNFQNQDWFEVKQSMCKEADAARLWFSMELRRPSHFTILQQGIPLQYRGYFMIDAQTSNFDQESIG